MIITSLWRRQPGRFFFLATKSGGGAWREKAFAREEIGEINAFIERNQDKDIYFCPHGFSRPERVKSAAQLPRLLWADLDAVDPRKIKFKPTVAIESSPGRFVGLWVTDREVTEELNKRVTYGLGADKGGWDLTQVLRVPGTHNYKYASTPRVRLLWDEGPTYKVDDAERMFGEVKRVDVRGVLEKWRGRMPAWLHRELTTGKPTPGKRSDMLWKMENKLVELKVPRDEILAMVKVSAWNKFAGRASENEQLNRELDKIIGDKPQTNGYDYLGISMAEIEGENTNWVWFPYLARGDVTIIEGDPGIGKSYLIQMIGKAVVDGEKLPSPKPMALPRGKVAFFDAENTASSVTKKRLTVNGCQHLGDFYQEEEPFTIDDEDCLAHVYEALEKLRPVLVVFDTISLYIGRADTAKASETTQALMKFKDIARRFNCAVVIVRHLTKGKSGERALYRGQGNIAFTGVARRVLSVGTLPDGDEGVKALAMTKANNSIWPKTLTFTIEGLPDTLKETDRSRFTWGEYVENVTSEDILVPAKNNGALGEAETFLKEIFDEEDEVEAARIATMAEKRSITRMTLHRASVKVGVKKQKTAQGWVWSL